MKIKYFPYQAHCFAFGGFENLMNSTFDSLKLLGISVGKIDLWSKDDGFDITHIWGLGHPNFMNIRWSKKTNKKIVVTAIFSDYLSIIEIFKHYFTNVLGRQKELNELTLIIDALIVTSERSKIVAIKYFKFPKEKVFIISNTLLNSYYDQYTDQQLNNFDIKDYVFTIGNVCKRKNQLNLALACIKLKVNLLIVGPIIPGEEAYGDELRALAIKSNNIIWLKGMKRDSIELISAYKKSLLFALPSFGEQQPTSAQEAGLLGKPLLLADLPYAKQKFYKNACLVNPNSVTSIAEGIQSIIDNPVKYVPPIDAFDDCKPSFVAEQYLKIYNALSVVNTLEDNTN
jgi:glycosyltransferase involved in cell wall biosynthesis